MCDISRKAETDEGVTRFAAATRYPSRASVLRYGRTIITILLDFAGCGPGGGAGSFASMINVNDTIYNEAKRRH